MELISTSQSLYRRRLSNIVYTNQLDSDVPAGNSFTYRTEVYLQEREKHDVKKLLPATTITTWKTIKYEKRLLDHDQVEIDRVLSTIDSIHGTFNRSLLISCHQVYSALYGDNDDDDTSICLMKTFCQRQDHCMQDEEKNQTPETSSSFGNFQDSDFDGDIEDEEEKENDNEKKNSYDSGYGSVLPIRQSSREPLLKITQPLNIN